MPQKHYVFIELFQRIFFNITHCKLSFIPKTTKGSLNHRILHVTYSSALQVCKYIVLCIWTGCGYKNFMLLICFSPFLPYYECSVSSEFSSFSARKIGWIFLDLVTETETLWIHTKQVKRGGLGKSWRNGKCWKIYSFYISNFSVILYTQLAHCLQNRHWKTIFL